MRPHEREALTQAIQTMNTMASMLRTGDEHAVKLGAWSNIIGEMLETDERMGRVDSVMARQLSDVLAANGRLAHELAEAKEHIALLQDAVRTLAKDQTLT